MNKQKRAWKRTVNRGTMKQATIMLIVLGALVTGNLSAWAESGNPFGFETNKHPLEYDYCKKESGIFRGHGYTCSSAPRPHPDLKEYKLQFVEDVGVCIIVGGQKGPNNTPIGTFKDQIAKKYGPPTDTADGRGMDFLRHAWYPRSGFNGLGDVLAIEIKANFFSSPSWIQVGFSLVTYNACNKKIDDKADHAF